MPRPSKDPPLYLLRRRSRAVPATLCLLLGLAGGCSRKLSSGGGAMDTLMYDVLKADRDTGYYYDVLLNAHDRSTFAYVASDDPYIADKCVDAIVHLGRASYNRLEGEVQVILLLSDVVLEDPSALARASAAGALTTLGTKLPEASSPGRPERGLRYLAVLKELDAMHDEQGRPRDGTPAARQHAVALVDEVGSYDFPNLQLTKDGLRFFPTKPWVTRATDPAMREALDRAMVRRSRAVVLASLEGAVLDRNHNVRVDAVKGLKTLRDAGAQDALLDRLGDETNSWVRGEMAEYFGAVGGRRSAEALLRLLEDDDGGVRLRARRALTRIAGDDLGKEVAAWKPWLDRAYPAQTASATPPAGGAAPPPVPAAPGRAVVADPTAARAAVAAPAAPSSGEPARARPAAASAPDPSPPTDPGPLAQHAAPVTGRRPGWRVVARLAGLALVAYVLATQVRLHDEIVLVDGTVLAGRAQEVEGGWRLEASGSGAGRTVRASEVRTERYGGREIPSVTFGFPTLLRRLSGSWPAVAGVVGALFSLAVLTAWRWRWLVEALGLALSAREGVRYTLYGLFFNLVVPGATGGDVVKAWYAARRTGAATKAVVSVFVDRAVGLFALVLLAAAVLFLGPSRDGFAAPRLLVAGVLGGALLFVVLVLSRRVRRGLGLSSLLRRLPFQHVLSEVDAAFRLYRRHPGSLAVGLGVSVVNHAGAAACAFVLARALGLGEVRLLDALALVPVVSLLTAVPLLPGGWGVGELGFAYFFGQVGVAPSEAVGLSVVFRLATLAASLPGGVLWFAAREPVGREEMAAEIGRGPPLAGAATPEA